MCFRSRQTLNRQQYTASVVVDFLVTPPPSPLTAQKKQKTQIPAHGRSISRSSFGSFKSNDSSSFRSIDSLSELFPAKVSPLSTTVNTVGAASNGNSARGDAEDVKTRRQDWKLDANELSLIRREEERVMKPDVLGKLLASGASLGCKLQLFFWGGGGGVC